MTLTDRLEKFFRAHPNTWVDGRELAQIAGYAAWRTRISDCRKRGMTIENTVTYHEFYRVSRYRYVEVA